MYKIIKLDTYKDERGQLISIENSRSIPFDMKRVFYIFKVKRNAKRGQHANMKAQEIIICLNGCCELLLNDGKGQKVNIKLSEKDEAIYIEPRIWIELSNFSKECLVMVLSDYYYEKKHQIRDYLEFTNAVR